MCKAGSISSRRSIKDKLGKPVFLRPHEEGDFNGLSEMYDEFEPKGKAMGLPPALIRDHS
jgi:hypothetical protein